VGRGRAPRRRARMTPHRVPPCGPPPAGSGAPRAAAAGAGLL